MSDKAKDTAGETEGAAIAAAVASLKRAPGPTPEPAAKPAPEPGAAPKAASSPEPPPPAPNADAPPAADASPPPGKAEAKPTLFGVLDAEQRIRRAAEQHERTLWMGAIAATLVYASLIAGQAVSGAASLVALQQQQKEKRGQDAPNSINVELVPDPDRNAKTKHWREGKNVPAPQQNQQPPQPPQPEQQAALAQPEAEQKEPAKDTTDEPRPDGSPMLLDLDSLVDAAAADLTRKINEAYARKAQKRREQRQAATSGDMQLRGMGASGKSSAFTRSVIAALMKTRPGPFALWGHVLVSFQIGKSGEIEYVHMLRTSGNSALDDAAVEAIRKARFERPPPNLSPDDRTYIIDYIFG